MSYEMFLFAGTLGAICWLVYHRGQNAGMAYSIQQTARELNAIGGPELVRMWISTRLD